MRLKTPPAIPCANGSLFLVRNGVTIIGTIRPHRAELRSLLFLLSALPIYVQNRLLLVSVLDFFNDLHSFALFKTSIVRHSHIKPVPNLVTLST